MNHRGISINIMPANEASSNPVQLSRLAFRWILSSFDGGSGAEEQVRQSVLEVIGQEDGVTFLIFVEQLEEAGDALSVKPLAQRSVILLSEPSLVGLSSFLRDVAVEEVDDFAAAAIKGSVRGAFVQIKAKEGMQFLREGSVLKQWIWRTGERAIQHQRVQYHALEGI